MGGAIFQDRKTEELTGGEWAGYSLGKHQEVCFGHVKSEMSDGHSK